MTEQTDPRSTRSRAALLQAATDWLDEADPDVITVRAIAQRAGTTRPTFYAHFSDLPTIFQAAALQRFTQLFGGIDGSANLHADVTMQTTVIEPLLAGLQARSLFYLRVLRGPRGYQTQRAAIDYLAGRIANVPPLSHGFELNGINRRDAAVFLASGLVGMITDWLASDLDGDNSVNAMATRLTALLAFAAGEDK